MNASSSLSLYISPVILGYGLQPEQDASLPAGLDSSNHMTMSVVHIKEDWDI